MIPEPLRIGDTIGIISPSHVAKHEDYDRFAEELNKMGYKVKFGKNLFKSTHGYSASEQERAEDFNSMISDSSVKMIFFSGGEGSNELLPYIDFDNIRLNPKILLSYSDGTTLLDAVYLKAGLVTYYGQAPENALVNPTEYNLSQFKTNITDGKPNNFTAASKWYSLNPGSAEGTLIGGYILNFMRMVNDPKYPIDMSKSYILMLEEHEKFQGIPNLSASLAHIEQSDFMQNVKGLIFGHYSMEIYPELMERLRRFGSAHDIPVVYCDDFGHGENHAILPIGTRAVLNADEQSLIFNYSTV